MQIAAASKTFGIYFFALFPSINSFSAGLALFAVHPNIYLLFYVLLASLSRIINHYVGNKNT